MTGPLAELQRLSAEAKSKKGRMDADSRKQAAAVLQLIWTDPVQDPKASLPYLPDLKAEALAEWIGPSWPNMTSERRSLFEQWLPDPATERDIRRLAFLIGALIAIDSVTAVRWLRRLLPSDRKSPTKETRQHLAAGVLDGNLELSALALETSPPAETLRLYAALWSVATEPGLDVPLMARVRLARAIVAFGTKQVSATRIHALDHLYDQIRKECDAWPAALRNEFEVPGERQDGPPIQQKVIAVPAEGNTRANESGDVLEKQTGVLAAQALISATGTPAGAATSRASDPDPATGTHESLKPSERRRDLATDIDDWIVRLPEAIGVLRRAQEECRRYTEAKRTYEVRQQEIADLKQQIDLLRSSIGAVIQERDAGREDAARERARADELSARLAQLVEDGETERRRLAQQISANASGRIEEYKNKLASSLSRLVTDLPARNADVSPELGQILLLQFHQFLDALRRDGIGVQTGEGRA